MSPAYKSHSFNKSEGKDSPTVGLSDLSTPFRKMYPCYSFWGHLQSYFPVPEPTNQHNGPWSGLDLNDAQGKAGSQVVEKNRAGPVHQKQNSELRVRPAPLQKLSWKPLLGLCPRSSHTSVSPTGKSHGTLNWPGSDSQHHPLGGRNAEHSTSQDENLQAA